MATFVLTYNPDRWTWPADDRARAIESTQRGGTVADSWSTGVRTREIAPGERAVLLQQGRGPRGLIARGTFTSVVGSGPHWSGSAGQANFAKLRWDLVLEDEDVIPLADVMDSVGGVPWNSMQGSGVRVPDESEAALDELWARYGYPRDGGGQGPQDDPRR